ncbi:MAG: YdcF family protein [Candidatus Micrarchaeales archaeon]|nr:YdcF family protein [Candidatus Micrarchaeales archaeon]
MARIAVLLGNGIFDSNMKNYKEYVDEFIEFANRNKVDKAVICGGHTDSRAKLSEASSIRNYVAPRLNKKTKLLIEEKSITASQSIKFTKPLLKLKKTDDVSVFCNSVVAVKVMWFIMHYWFGLTRKEIENDALNYIALYYSKRNGVDDVGKGIAHTGVLYENVEVHPCHIVPSIENAIAQQLVSLVDIAALYNPQLYNKFINATKKRYGLKK